MSRDQLGSGFGARACGAPRPRGRGQAAAPAGVAAPGVPPACRRARRMRRRRLGASAARAVLRPGGRGRGPADGGAGGRDDCAQAPGREPARPGAGARARQAGAADRTPDDDLRLRRPVDGVRLLAVPESAGEPGSDSDASRQSGGPPLRGRGVVERGRSGPGVLPGACARRDGDRARARPARRRVRRRRRGALRHHPHQRGPGHACRHRPADQRRAAAGPRRRAARRPRGGRPRPRPAASRIRRGERRGDRRAARRGGRRLQDPRGVARLRERHARLAGRRRPAALHDDAGRRDARRPRRDLRRARRRRRHGSRSPVPRECCSTSASSCAS